MEKQLAGAAVGAVVASFVRPLADEAARLAKEEIALLWGVDEEIEKLSQTLTSIRSVLACAEQREPTDERVGTWLARLRDVAIDADDVLDDFATEAAIRRPSGSMLPPAGRRRGSRPRRGCLSSCFPCVHMVTFRHEIGYRIKEIREKLGEIDGDHRQLGLIDVGGGTSSVATATDATDARETTSINVIFVGRGKEKEEIIQKLLGRPLDTEEPQISSAGHHGGDGDTAVSLVPIVGMGGIGKTALAQAIFNENRVVKSFPFRQWVHVGEKFEPKRIIKQIVGASDSTSTLEDLQSCLLQKLRQQRFLIILDDVWSEDYDKWKQILPPLMQGGGKGGGAVVFTTRSQKVAAAAGANTDGSSSLMGLHEEDCWQIFEKRAFGGGSSAATHPDLRNVGREIVKKLNGVPLAVMAVAGFLRETPEESRWMNVLASITWPLRHGVLPVLKLSYHHLPSPLKQCFAYCSVFPKGYVFDRSKIVQMWIAQSYISPQVGMRLEEKAGIYFDDLHLRSFLQRVPHGDGYQMHDLMHDLARWVSSEESHIVGEDGSSAREPTKVFHVSYFSNDSGVVDFQKLYVFRRARSLLYLHEPSTSATLREIPRHLFDEHLRCIRVLCLSYCDMEELPDTVGELKHLRYLDLSFTKIGLLPESICDLWNLQTLRILDSELTMVLVELPRGMSKLVNLRHLNLHEDLVGNIPGIGKLSSLQGLKVFYVGKEDGHRITELKDLMQLGGELSIKNLENVQSKDAAAQANLKNKLYIDELGLEWPDNWDANTRNIDLEMEVLEGLQPPPNLRTLRISNNGGLRHPAWMSGKLPHNLRSISLHGCRNWPCLPPLGCLPYLKVLVIGGAGVKQVGHEVYGTVACRGVRTLFPALEELDIYDMVEWEEWKEVAATAAVEETTVLFPALRRFHIRNCPKLRTMPRLSLSLAQLKLHGMGLRSLPEIPPCADHGAPRASSLSTLEIRLCPSLESIPMDLLRSLTSLMELEIRECRELASVDLHSHHLRSLKSLTIIDCPKLALEEKDNEEPCSSSLLPSPSAATTSSMLLPSLELLTSDNSSVLERLLHQERTALQNLIIKNSSCVPGDLRGIHSLSKLCIMNCPQLQSLPELQHLSNLGRLWVDDCPQLESLPLLRGLSQLTKLCVVDCPMVQSLPEGVLPATVKHLHIKGCPGLRERCQRELGEDWPKIAHVPNNFIS